MEGRDWKPEYSLQIRGEFAVRHSDQYLLSAVLHLYMNVCSRRKGKFDRLAVREVGLDRSGMCVFEVCAVVDGNQRITSGRGSKEGERAVAVALVTRDKTPVAEVARDQQDHRSSKGFAVAKSCAIHIRQAARCFDMNIDTCALVNVENTVCIDRSSDSDLAHVENGRIREQDFIAARRNVFNAERTILTQEAGRCDPFWVSSRSIARPDGKGSLHCTFPLTVVLAPSPKCRAVSPCKSTDCVPSPMPCFCPTSEAERTYCPGGRPTNLSPTRCAGMSIRTPPGPTCERFAAIAWLSAFWTPSKANSAACTG